MPPAGQPPELAGKHTSACSQKPEQPIPNAGKGTGFRPFPGQGPRGSPGRLPDAPAGRTPFQKGGMTHAHNRIPLHGAVPAACSLFRRAGVLLFNFVVNGSQWAMQPYNGHVYSENSTVKLGDITDRDGNLLATTEDGVRIYSGDETVRRALLHTVGDPYGYISTSVQYTMRAKLSGYNIVTGLNDTIFNRMGSDIALTIDQDACVAAYNALGGKNGGVIVYNYETGEVLVKVSTPTFDPNAVPEDIETNDAYKGAYLDNTLSGSFTPGSIFKIVTAAAAMEKYPDTWSSLTYDCQGSVELAGSDITCLNGHAHGTQDMAAALGIPATCTLPAGQ